MAGASLLTYKPMSQVSHEEKMESYTLCFTVWVESLVNRNIQSLSRLWDELLRQKLY